MKLNLNERFLLNRYYFIFFYAPVYFLIIYLILIFFSTTYHFLFNKSYISLLVVMFKWNFKPCFQIYLLLSFIILQFLAYSLINCTPFIVYFKIQFSKFLIILEHFYFILYFYLIKFFHPSDIIKSFIINSVSSFLSIMSLSPSLRI